MTIGIGELYGGEDQRFQVISENIGFKTHVALPAIVQSFNAQAQTVDVQPTIRERVILEDNSISYQQYPLLINVPILYPQAGDYSITFPIKRGDECLVIFSDISIDNWWLYGNVQNPIEQRRHDLSDGIAIFGLKNQSKLVGQSVSNSLVIKNGNGNMISLDSSGNIYIKGNVVVDGNFTTKNGVTRLGDS